MPPKKAVARRPGAGDKPHRDGAPVSPSAAPGFNEAQQIGDRPPSALAAASPSVPSHPGAEHFARESLGDPQSRSSEAAGVSPWPGTSAGIQPADTGSGRQASTLGAASLRGASASEQAEGTSGRGGTFEQLQARVAALERLGDEASLRQPHGQDAAQPSAGPGHGSGEPASGDKPLWKPGAGPRRAVVKLPARSGAAPAPSDGGDAGPGFPGDSGRDSEAARHEPDAHQMAAAARAGAAPPDRPQPHAVAPSARKGGAPSSSAQPQQPYRDYPDDFLAPRTSAALRGGEGSAAAPAASLTGGSDADGDDLILHPGGGGGGSGGAAGLKHRHGAAGGAASSRRPGEPPESPIRKLMAAARRGAAAARAAASGASLGSINIRPGLDELFSAPLVGSSTFRLVFLFSGALVLLARGPASPTRCGTSWGQPAPLALARLSGPV